MTGQRRSPRSGLLADRGGSISVELALVLTVLLTLSLGAFDFGRVALEQLKVVNAARAGVQYAVQDPSAAADTDRIAAAVRRDAGAELAVASRTFCSCPGQAETACGQPCPDGGAPPLYVEVGVTGEVALVFAYPGISSPVAVSGLSAMRLR